MNDPSAEEPVSIFQRWVAAKESGYGTSIQALYERHPEHAARLAELHAAWLEGIHSTEGRMWIRARRLSGVKVRLAAWACVLLVAVLVAAYGAYCVSVAKRYPAIDSDNVRAILDGTPALSSRENDVVDYEDVLATFHHWNWTPTERAADLSRKLRVLSAQETAEVEYTSESGRREVVRLKTGDSLPPPFDHVRVALIFRDAVTFQLEAPTEQVVIAASKK